MLAIGAALATGAAETKPSALLGGLLINSWNEVPPFTLLAFKGDLSRL